MTLIKSISGIRGTIGGGVGDNLTPIDIVSCASAFGQWVIQKTGNKKVIIGRDARISGEMVNNLVINSLIALGIDVVDLGLSTTPTVEFAVPELGAGAGIVITASHNPKEWNALKFLNDKGEFISANDGKEVLDLITDGGINFVSVDELGSVSLDNTIMDKHIDSVLKLPGVDVEKVKNEKFKVVVDCINSTGSLSIVPLLEKLNCEVIAINAEPNGQFAHNPEPLAKHLTELSEVIVREKAHLGISVDPDVDRLAFVNEDGSMFGEEYTLVAVAEHVLSFNKGNTVSNLSSTRALRDVTVKGGGNYAAAAVGEVNVVTKMKETNAVIGGEGNGGVIYPAAHYGRDALVGVALFLTLLADKKCSMTALKASYPSYEIIKDKIVLTPELDVDALLEKVAKQFENEELNTIDGVKIDFSNGWVHLRKSNTEPIIRVYAEAATQVEAKILIDKVKTYL